MAGKSRLRTRLARQFVSSHKPACREMKRVAAGRKQRPWSELTDKEKKVRIGIMVALGLAVIAGFVVFLSST